jgi:hypothetical protein
VQFRNKEDDMKYHRPKAKLALACLLYLVAALGATPAFAGRRVAALPHTISVSEKAVASGPSSPAEMEAFLDDFFEAKMAELHIPGAAVVVVQNGNLFLAKGYGFADLHRRTPVDQYWHNRTGEDNADAHLKRQVMGREVVVAVTNGRLDFGTWERIFYGEFDGRRRKRVLVKIVGE